MQRARHLFEAVGEYLGALDAFDKDPAESKWQVVKKKLAYLRAAHAEASRLETTEPDDVLRFNSEGGAH